MHAAKRTGARGHVDDDDLFKLVRITMLKKKKKVKR
jgi:hypothetical protein